MDAYTETLTKVIKHLEVNAKFIEEIAETLNTLNHIIKLSEKAISDEELQKMSVVALVNVAIIGHINWKMGFLRSVLKGEIPKVERDHHKCLLGRSLPCIKQRLIDTPLSTTIDALEAPHAKLHGLVDKFEREVNINNKDEILQFIENEVLPTLENVIKLLIEIVEGCKKYGCE